MSNYILEPRKFAFRYTTKEPTHIIKKMEVMIVDADSWVRRAKVNDNSKDRINGPHRSPTSYQTLQWRSSRFPSSLSAGIIAYLSFITILFKSLFYFTFKVPMFLIWAPIELIISRLHLIVFHSFLISYQKLFFIKLFKIIGFFFHHFSLWHGYLSLWDNYFEVDLAFLLYRSNIEKL